MPTISSFYGIKICLFIDHLPPHIHIYYKNEVYRLNLNNGKFMENKVPKTLRKLINIWYNDNKDDLFNAWNKMQENGEVI